MYTKREQGTEDTWTMVGKLQERFKHIFMAIARTT